jgi:pimeloyl-ACP methyl ester carboxylesterase
VVAAIDECNQDDGRVLIVAHSAGGGVAHAAVDARPDRVARVIYVGGFPTPDGAAIVGDFPTDGPDIPLPDWSDFDKADLVGLDDAARESFRQKAIPAPASLTTAVQRLSNDRRYEVPVTLICTEYSGEMLQGWVEQGLEPVAELNRIRDVEYVDLPTGHWPQFTRSEDLSRRILERAHEPDIDE